MTLCHWVSGSYCFDSTWCHLQRLKCPRRIFPGHSDLKDDDMTLNQNIMTQLPTDTASYPSRMDSLATPQKSPPDSQHKEYNHCHHTMSISSLRLLLFFKMQMLWFVMRGLLFIFLLKINVTSEQLILSNYKLAYSHIFKRNQQQLITHSYTIYFIECCVYCHNPHKHFMKLVKLKVSALCILCATTA